MSAKQLMPEQALPAYRDFLRQVLSEVIDQISGEPSLTRLTRAMQVYWDACLSRRKLRSAAAQAAAGTAYETQFEPLGLPFLKLLRQELAQIGCANPEQLSRDVYLCARGVTLEEARSGRRETQHRQSLLHCLREATLD